MAQNVLPRAVTRLVAVAVFCAVIQGAGFAADGGRAEKTGKIVLYADFLDGGADSSAGLYAVDPATDVWTKIVSVPRQNGVVSLATIRVAPDGLTAAYNEYETAKGKPYASAASLRLQGLRPGEGSRQVGRIAGRPVWSPDGRELLLVEAVGGFEADGPGRFATWRVGADGSRPVRLPVPDTDEVGDWSSDGRWLAASAPVPGKGFDRDVVVMRPDGSERRRLTGSGRNLWPRFSHDGTRVAYHLDAKEGKGVWVVDLDGRNRRRVYANEGDSFVEHAAWSPDGTRLAAVLLTWSRDAKGNRTLGGETLGCPRLCVIDVADGRLRGVPHPPARLLGTPDWR